MRPAARRARRVRRRRGPWKICIEIASPSNTANGLARKAEAFVQAGALEVVVIAVDARSARYFHADGEHDASRFTALRLPLLG